MSAPASSPGPLFNPGEISPIPEKLKPVLAHIESLANQQRYIEAFREALTHFAQESEECLIDACMEVSLLASRWDRQKRIAPYPLFDHFEDLAASFGRHIQATRRLDSDPFRATSNLYRFANKIYMAWINHAYSVLEHQHRRTNTVWIQSEWIQPNRFSILLNILRSAVRNKLPLDLLGRIYGECRRAILVGKEAISILSKKDKFEADCLRIIASPTKDVIPDLCLQIFRDIIDCYVRAGEWAAALTFCEQALLLKRGDKTVETIKANVLRESLRHGGGPLRPSPGPPL